MKSGIRVFLRIILALLLAALLGACLYLNGLMPIITGYAAKNLASAVFVSGRDPADVEALDLHFSFIKFNRNQVDYADRSVTSRFLWGRSTAICRDGYGVTLLRGKGADALRGESFPIDTEMEVPEPLPAGDSLLRVRLEPIARALVDDHAYNGTPFAFVVLHKGGVVAERYREGMDAGMPFLSWSIAKSFVQALAGIMARDSLVDLHAPLEIPEWKDDERSRITLNDLLQMQSGLEWNEDYGSRSDVNLMLHREEDMGLYALSKPLVHEPGTHWYYSSGNSNIVMRYLRGRFDSDAAFLAYLHGRLFGPLGIRNARFEPDMNGTPVGSSYLYLTAREFARFGQLYLDDGCVAGKRILPEGWVDYTRTPASDSRGAYGSSFWLNRNRSLPDAPEDLFSCNGHDGQQIYIIPSKDLVVVVLGYSPKPDRKIDFNALLRDVSAAL